VTKVVIVGAGKGGRALLEMFSGDPTVTIIGVADVNPWAPGLELARRLNIAVSTDLRELVADPRVDLIIDVTGNAQVQEAIQRLKPPGTEVMGGASAKFMWDLLAERQRSEELEDRYSLMLRELQAKDEGELIIGQNPKMRELAEQVIRVAQTPTTVLIRGESGTGKELVARAIHRYSNLRDKPLVTVNCTALTATLMESELFGHKRGSFTGAVADKVGLFEKADGATIFLDEVGDMPLEMQGKLLRVLQAGEVKPVGDVVTRKVRVRVIAATNRDLEKALAGSEFREDLFYRFNAFTVVLPPLRERSEDIPVLAYHFLRKAEAKVNKKVDRFSQDALDMLKRYSWPCASWRTSSSGPWSSPQASRLTSPTCPSTFRSRGRSGSRPTRASCRPRSGWCPCSRRRLSPGSCPRPAATSRWPPRRPGSPGETSTGCYPSTP
jgi:hypothetical protein